ncbi:MAG: DMT family transporter [Cohaesibacter sp.]|nr:DMT family transporter [Cohaesibacter sp.]
MRAYSALLLAMILIGSNIPLGKIIVETVPPASFALLRFILATIVLVPLAMTEKNVSTILRALSPRQWLEITILSLFGVVFFTTFMLIGIRYTSAINAGIITSALPAVIAALSFLVLRETISVRTAFSIALAVLGIACLNLAGPSAHGASETASPLQSPAPSLWLGNGLIFAAICSEATFAVLSRRYAALIPPLTLATLVHAIAIPITIPLMYVQDGGFQMGESDATFWGLALYYILTASVVSFYLWCYAIKSIEASMAAIFTALIPVTSLIFAILVLDESLSLIQSFGMLTVLASLFIGLQSSSRAKASIKTRVNPKIATPYSSKIPPTDAPRDAHEKPDH